MFSLRKRIKKEVETSTAEQALRVSKVEFQAAEDLSRLAAEKVEKLEKLLEKNHFAENFRKSLGYIK